ncbi:hypothetical protein XELAEV_18010070mg [Xenopus laevis]|uniref:Uncharacterized protein n=1 Tax=Xenopus laevis TaxID=8355 RepID=A0A974DTV0_XENLA|nr:hypothetical protein XELAEV_18010070mg [Xenopus laevis]
MSLTNVYHVVGTLLHACVHPSVIHSSFGSKVAPDQYIRMLKARLWCHSFPPSNRNSPLSLSFHPCCPPPTS